MTSWRIIELFFRRSVPRYKYHRRFFFQSSPCCMFWVFNHFHPCFAFIMKKQRPLFFWPYLPTLRQKCPNTEFFLVRIFLYSDLIRTVFSPNTRKYGPEKTLHLDTFHAVHDFKNKYFLYSSHHEKYVINLSFKRLLETFSNIPLNLQIYL